MANLTLNLTFELEEPSKDKIADSGLYIGGSIAFTINGTVNQMFNLMPADMQALSEDNSWLVTKNIAPAVSPSTGHPYANGYTLNLFVMDETGAPVPGYTLAIVSDGEYITSPHTGNDVILTGVYGDLKNHFSIAITSAPAAVKNLYDEYIFIGDKWEKLGDTDTRVDLTGYATEAYVDNLIAALIHRIETLENSYLAKEIVTELPTENIDTNKIYIKYKT